MGLGFNMNTQTAKKQKKTIFIILMTLIISQGAFVSVFITVAPDSTFETHIPIYTPNDSSEHNHKKPGLITSSSNTTYLYEFNTSTGYSDQYIANLSFTKDSQVTITGTWMSNAGSDQIDFGLYDGDTGTELAGYASDELTGWALATGGGSPEETTFNVLFTSNTYYIRIINFANSDNTGTITIIEEQININFDFQYYDRTNISIVLLGYSAQYFNENEFLVYLPASGVLRLNNDITTGIVYDYTVEFANATYTQDFENFVLANSVNGTNTTAKLNITALEYQRDNLYRQDIFEPQDGRAINATAVDIYFAENPYNSSADFSIYLTNFSMFDTPDHSLEHWFNVTESEPDIGINRHWWRLEWDNPMNFDARFPYAGYGFSGRHFFLDPYAFQWYLNWSIIWRGVATNDGLHDFYTQDLDEYQKTQDITTQSGRSAIMTYLGSWVAELIPQYLGWTPLNEIPDIPVLDIEIIVFNNVTQQGFSNADLQWTVQENSLASVFQDLLPQAQIITNVTVVNLDNWPAISSILTSNTYTHSPYPPQNNWEYYDGYDVYSQTSSRRGTDFNISPDGITITAYMFVLDNASFAAGAIPWTGKEFTGLGGNGHLVMLMELDRLYYPDWITHRQSLTDILIHETGHAIGFPHTFSSTKLGSDFIWDVMGYYPGSGQFSKIRQDMYQQYQAIIAIQEQKEQLITIALASGFFPAVDILLTKAEPIFQQIESAFDAHEYISAKNYVTALEDVVNRLNSLTNLNDTTAPTLTALQDQIYNEGTPSITITWMPGDDNPYWYTIFEDSIILTNGSWNGNNILIIRNNLSIGVYNYTLVVEDALGLLAIDSVLIELAPGIFEFFSPVVLLFWGITLTIVVVWHRKRKTY